MSTEESLTLDKRLALMQSLRIKTLSLHMPSRSLHLEGEAELQHGRVHGDRCLFDRVSQNRRRRG